MKTPSSNMPGPIEKASSRNGRWRSNGEICSWSPLIYGASEYCLVGLSEDGAWVSETADGVVAPERDGGFTLFLRILEMDSGEFYSALKQLLKGSKLSGVSASDFPVNQVLVRAFESNSDYWAELGLTWLEQSREPIALCVSESLKALQSEKSVAQRVRQRAAKISRRSVQGVGQVFHNKE